MACGVELVEQTSRSLCIRNFSFGCLNRTTIWASECRGKFRCLGGDAFECGTPPGGAPRDAPRFMLARASRRVSDDRKHVARCGARHAASAPDRRLFFGRSELVEADRRASGRRLFFGSSDGPIPPEIRALANPAMLGLPFVHAANFEPSPELLDEAKGLIDALRSGEGIDALLARHEEVMREFRLDAVYDHKD